MWRSCVLVLLALEAIPLRTAACSCFGPQTFCETLNPQPPQFPDPQWWVPDHIVLGVKQATVGYGVDLRVVQDFRHGLQPDEVVRVWGDCGFLCRMYVDEVNDGDTVLWGIRQCDLTGNFGCGTSLEEPGHFQLSICGVYWLGYASGIISGPLFTEGVDETVGIEDFGDLVQGCLPMGINDPGAAAASVWCHGTAITIETGGEWSESKRACIMDAGGRVLLDAGFRGSRSTFPIQSESSGILIVRVTDGRRSHTTRFHTD